MPISVTCPECDATYRVADEAAGKAIKCKKCGARVSVPAGGEDEGVGALGNGTDDDAGTDAGAKPKKKGKGKLIAIIGVVLLLLTCCVCTPGGYFGTAYFAKIWPFGAGGAGGGGVAILDKKETLTDKDAKIKMKSGMGMDFEKPVKQYKVQLEAKQKYRIEMKADKQGLEGGDPYLVLLDPSGKEVARDDDGGGFPNARILYTPTVSGQFTIQATCFVVLPPAGMPFTLTVRKE